MLCRRGSVHKRKKKKVFLVVFKTIVLYSLKLEMSCVVNFCSSSPCSSYRQTLCFQLGSFLLLKICSLNSTVDELYEKDFQNVRSKLAAFWKTWALIKSASNCLSLEASQPWKPSDIQTFAVKCMGLLHAQTVGIIFFPCIDGEVIWSVALGMIRLGYGRTEIVSF